MLKYKDLSILPPAVAKLPWTHNCILLDKIMVEIGQKEEYPYAKICTCNGWNQK
ncbi:MAG: hypothetical protein IJ890_04305 [Clostridia bacterium]|nr:hypothetical protein [Clostridia bacterium]